MFCFNSKKKLIDTGIFNGATDWHSHILPGVDDGIQTMQDSLKALSYYESIGIKEVWLTPHIMEDIPNTTSELRARYEELQNEVDALKTDKVEVEEKPKRQYTRKVKEVE